MTRRLIMASVAVGLAVTLGTDALIAIIALTALIA